MSAAGWDKLRAEQISATDLATIPFIELKKLKLTPIDEHVVWQCTDALENRLKANGRIE